MSFPNTGAPRTDETFRNRAQVTHHKEYSLLEELKIDMIASIPTSEPLHLLDLGIMRKCLYRWVYGAKGYARKWSKSLINLTSRLLQQCQQQKPADIHRAIRPLNHLRHWKGTEYRSMLLYIGMVVFKKVFI